MVSKYYKETYGEKVYKLPVALPLTCPNRDGSAGVGGCTFCGEIGAGYENRPAWMTVRMQLEENIAHIGPKYKAKKFIPYYQNFSNTYLSLDDFKSYMEQGCIDEAVGIAIATRPDCIADEYLDILADIRDRFQKDIYIELGLQTVNYDTLEKINRGHDLAQFIDAVLRIKRYGFNVTTHMIVNLPWDTMKDTIEGARILSALGVDQVKLHALYIVKNTLMAKWYQEGQFTLISAEEYADRVVNFVRHLHPDIVLQRLVGRAPEDNTLFINWSMGCMSEQVFTFPTYDLAQSILGQHNRYLHMMLEVISADVVARGDTVVIKGDEENVNALYRTLEELVFLYREGSTITESQVRIAAKLVANGKADAVHNMFEDTLSVNMRGKNITPKTEGQKYYVDSIRKNTITFGIGPAGTGKTFLAVALAAFYLKNRNVDKIILTRPAVEAGERLGFLPGELQDKVDPYLRPLYDALHEMFGIEQVQRFMERGTIEVAPLAYMRGRTLENAFVILDEAQNTTAEQMKMFLTRLGNNSKMVVNGDKTQIDLPPRVVSGLGEAEKVLRHVSGINMVYFSDQDVVRHDLVGRIVKAYDAYHERKLAGDTTTTTDASAENVAKG